MLARHCRLVALFALLALRGAALEWKAVTMSVTTVPFQATQDVVFEFRNDGPRPVRILDVQTNCDCLAADPDRKTYAPGARGAIKASFTIGDRAGPYERVITVVTDESPAPVRLTVRIEVPETAILAPRSVAWKVNDPAAEKTVEVTANAGLEITFAEAVPTNGDFSATLETVAAGRHYRLHVTPRGTARPASAAIRSFGREKSGHDVVVSAYANVE
jgi:hypothetical protein